MKTAISVPDETFERASSRAVSLDISRSEFFARAVVHYIQHLDAQSLTEQIDEALTLIGEDDSATVAVAAGRERLAHGEDDW